MHGGIPIRLACVLAVACVGPGVAEAQYEQLAGPETYATIAQLPYGQAEGGLGWAQGLPVDSLTPRFERSEDALKKAEDTGAVSGKKAASKLTYQLRGRTFIDTAFFSQSDENKAVYGEARNGIGFRAVWLGLEGEIFDLFSYCTEIDLVSGIFDNDGAKPLLGDGVVFRDVWIGMHDLPVLQNARVGHFKEPFMLEELTSNRFITFMERTMIEQAVVPGYNLGGMIFGKSEDQNLLWQTGVFQNDVPETFVSRTADDLSGAWTSRIVWLPWYDECTEGRGLLHLGAAYSYRDAFDNAHRFRAQPSARFGAPFVVDAGAPLLNDYQLAGVEAALVYGPLSIQSECVQAWLDSSAAVGQNIWGFYAMVSYFLTGENRAYKRDLGRFDRVRPIENFLRVRAEDGRVYTGRGAWELAYRFDYLDATEVSVSAGLAANHTFGLNWYLSPHNRIMWNYIHCEPHTNGADTGTIDALTMRFQVDL